MDLGHVVSAASNPKNGCLEKTKHFPPVFSKHFWLKEMNFTPRFPPVDCSSLSLSHLPSIHPNTCRHPFRGRDPPSSFLGFELHPWQLFAPGFRVCR